MGNHFRHSSHQAAIIILVFLYFACVFLLILYNNHVYTVLQLFWWVWVKYGYEIDITAMKYALGPTPCLTTELKDLNGHTLLERDDQQLKHWTEHFTQLSNIEVPFKDQALDSLDQIPVVNHLDSQDSNT